MTQRCPLGFPPLQVGAGILLGDRSLNIVVFLGAVWRHLNMHRFRASDLDEEPGRCREHIGLVGGLHLGLMLFLHQIVSLTSLWLSLQGKLTFRGHMRTHRGGRWFLW